jgi:glucose uptake protein GlcU
MAYPCVLLLLLAAVTATAVPSSTQFGKLPTVTSCAKLCPQCADLPVNPAIASACKCNACWPGSSLDDTSDKGCDCFAKLGFCKAGEKPIYTPGKECPSCWPPENKACNCFASVGFCKPPNPLPTYSRCEFDSTKGQFPPGDPPKSICPGCKNVTSCTCPKAACWPGTSFTDTSDHTCDCFAKLSFCKAGEKPTPPKPWEECPSCWPPENSACNCVAKIGFCEKQKAGSGKKTGVGYIGIAVAAVGFGSNFVVIKNKAWDPKDGMFFQFNMVIGVFFTGMLYTYAVRGAPPLQPLAMLGGAGWAIGNAACPFIIETIGMGLGLSIWGTANMLTGWSSGHFGILGVEKETVTGSEGLNVAGALVAIVAILMYAQVQNKSEDEEGTAEEKTPLVASNASSINAPATPTRKKAPKWAGMAVAVVAGILFGACFNPATYVTDQAGKNHCNALTTAEACSSFVGGSETSADERIYCSWDACAKPGKQCGGMPAPDLAFSQFCGIFFASFFIMVSWGAYKQFIQGETMYLNKELVVPGVASGIIWAFAQIGWFIANDNLPFVVTFPIITTLPAILANFYGYFIFNELDTAPANVAKLMAGICCSILAGVLIAASDPTAKCGEQ